MLFLAGRDHYTQRTLHRDIFERLSTQAGCEEIRYRPSRRRPRYVVADIDTTMFLHRSYSVAHARLEIRFWYPLDVEDEYYRINWIEPERNMMIGFHRDSDHPDLGPCHIQLNYRDVPVERHAAAFLNKHPLTVLDERLQHISEALTAVTWQEDRPSLSQWPV